MHIQHFEPWPLTLLTPFADEATGGRGGRGWRYGNHFLAEPKVKLISVDRASPVSGAKTFKCITHSKHAAFWGGGLLDGGGRGVASICLALLLLLLVGIIVFALGHHSRSISVALQVAPFWGLRVYTRCVFAGCKSLFSTFSLLFLQFWFVF